MSKATKAYKDRKPWCEVAVCPDPNPEFVARKMVFQACPGIEEVPHLQGTVKSDSYSPVAHHNLSCHLTDLLQVCT